MYVQTDTLLFADVFESFRDTFIDIYRLILLISYLHLDNMASLLEKDRRKIRISNRHPYPLMIEEGIRCGMCQSTHRYAKANNKYMKNYDKNIESSYLIYLVLIIFTRKKKIGKSRKISL